MSEEGRTYRAKVVQIEVDGEDALYALIGDGSILKYEPASYPDIEEGDPPVWRMIEPPVFGPGGNIRHSYVRQRADWRERSKHFPDWKKTTEQPPSATSEEEAR